MHLLCSDKLKMKAAEKPERHESVIPLATISEKEKSPSPVEVDENLPHFTTQLPATLTTHEGENIVLKCRLADSDERNVVTWYRGTRELSYSLRYRIATNDREGCVMELMSAMLTDTGEYIAVARNVHGETKTRCYVEVLPKRKPSLTTETSVYEPRTTRYTMRSTSVTQSTSMSTYRAGSGRGRSPTASTSKMFY